MRAALAQIHLLPGHAYMSVNASPATAAHLELAATLAPCSHRVVLEITEHAPIDRYDQLLDAFSAIRPETP